MPYVDAMFDRDQDIIRVVERRDGKRHFTEYPENIPFIMKILEASIKACTAILLLVLYVKTPKTFAKKLLLTKARTCLKATSIQSSNV